MQFFRNRAVELLFPAECDAWLAVLRFGLGLQVVVYCLSLHRDWTYLFAGKGNSLISRELTEALLSLDSPLVPRFGWLTAIGDHLGLSEATILSLSWTILFSAGCCLLLGLFCRFAATSAWFLHLCAAASGELMSYGMDNFMTIGLFYLMIAPLPDRYSFDRRLRKVGPRDPQLLGFYRRVLQLHLCIIYFFGGITKSIGSEWWNGTSIWRALTLPPFNLVAPEMLVSWKHFLPLAGIFVCVLETGYPFLIVWKKTRLIWLVGILGMHLAIAFAMGLYLFALILIILNLAAFGPGCHFKLRNWTRATRP